MTPHAKVYMKHFGLGIDDLWCCERCGKQGPIQRFDLHHVHGSGKGKDVIINLMSLCRSCHTASHTSISKSEMQQIHDNFLKDDKSHRIF